MNTLKQNNGITLIALIITIIVLLILAGVVINMTLGNDGIIAKAQSSVDKYQNAQEKEEWELAKYENMIDGNRNVGDYTLFGIPASAGSGTQSNPYIITTSKQLYLLACMFEAGWNFDGKYFELGNDINLSEVCSQTLNKNWISIGTTDNKFNGIFDGKKHKIKNLYQVNNGKNINGLFGTIGENGEVKNIILENAYISNPTNNNIKLVIGGISGVNQGTISRCKILNTSSLYGSRTTSETESINSVVVGGLAGQNDTGGEIIECCYSGRIEGNQETKEGWTYLGGISGSNNGTISYCYNLGELKTVKTGACGIGGIAGQNNGVINNVYAKCSINASGVNYSQWQYTGSIAGNGSGTNQKAYYNTNLSSNKTETEMKANQFVTDINDGTQKFKYVENNFPALAWE